MRVLRLLCGVLCATACGTNVDLGGSPSGVDGSDAPRDAGGTCPAFASPTTMATCKACSPSSSSCQLNGCFNGYFCDTTGEPDCKAPGTPCKKE